MTGAVLGLNKELSQEERPIEVMEEQLPTLNGLRVPTRMTKRESRTEITIKESRNTDTKACDVTDAGKGYLERKLNR